MRFPGDDRRSGGDSFVAAEDASRLASEAVEALERATGIEWYERAGTDVDRAALTLCRLRRAGAGHRGSPAQGDDAVHEVLSHATPAALIWFASRAVSYMDENGYPEAVTPWFRDEWDQASG